MQTESANTTTGEYMTDPILSLGDIPDLGDFTSDGNFGEAFADGWYQGVVLGKREFTDKNGNDRLFESGDSVSANGGSRNIRLQVELKRASDGRTLNTTALVNYQPADLSQETVQAIAAQREKAKEDGSEWGSLFRPYMVLTRLAKLQKIAGVRQLQRNAEGGLDLSSLYGKVAYFKLGEDKKNPQYKSIVDFRESKPTKVPVL